MFWKHDTVFGHSDIAIDPFYNGLTNNAKKASETR